MPTMSFKKAIEFGNYYFYSKPMTVMNINSVQLPIIPALKELKTLEHDVFRIRSSHGFLHVISAMELLDKIHATYAAYVVDYEIALRGIAAHFAIEHQQLLELIKLAIFFHDSAREGDGQDLWDTQSATACREFLINEWQLDSHLATFISDTIRFKDSPQEFKDKYQSIPHADYMRQLVNMSDTLEVIRTRDTFNPAFLPIAAHVSEEVMRTEIIPNLVIPHRQHIIDQGRLKKNGQITYVGYDDSQYVPAPGADDEKMAAAYLQKSREYELSILDIQEDNLQEVLERALRGVNTYLEEYKTSRVQFFHNSFFSPRYHGETGRMRAHFYKEKLSDEDISPLEKAKILYNLLANEDGATLKDEVLRSLNQVNAQKITIQLATVIEHMSGLAPNDIYLIP